MRISDSAVKVQLSRHWIKYYLIKLIHLSGSEIFSVEHDTFGTVTIEVNEPELESVAISPKGIVIVCHLNLQIEPQDMLIASRIEGVVRMEMEIMPCIIESTFHSNLVVRRMEWLRKPKVKLGKFSFAPEKVLAKILRNQIPRISALLARSVDEKINTRSILSDVGKRIEPFQMSFLSATISEILIVIQRIDLGDESMSLGAHVEVGVNFSEAESAGPVIEVQMGELRTWPDDSYLRASLELSELNELCKVHIKHLRDLLSEHQIEFSEFKIISKDENLNVELSVTKPIEIPLLAELKLTYRALGELLEMPHFSVGTSKGAGLLAKGLLFVANSKIEQLVLEKFPLKLSIVRSKIEEILHQISLVHWHGELIHVDAIQIGEKITMKIRKKDQWQLEKEEKDAIIDTKLSTKSFKEDV